MERCSYILFVLRSVSNKESIVIEIGLSILAVYIGFIDKDHTTKKCTIQPLMTVSVYIKSYT